MAVSEKHKARKRYIAFVLTSRFRPRRGDMIHAINVSLPRSVPRSCVQLTMFDGEAGIVLCQHTHRDEVIRSLGQINMVAGSKAGVETITTSGTIQQARLRLEKKVKRSLKELNKKKDNSRDGRRTPPPVKAQRGLKR